MAVIKPFKAVRPKPRFVERVSTLPYDVFTNKEARDTVVRNPMSFLKIVRPETTFPRNVDMYSDKVYERARALIRDNINKGIFVEEERETYYNLVNLDELAELVRSDS